MEGKHGNGNDATLEKVLDVATSADVGIGDVIAELAAMRSDIESLRRLILNLMERK